MYSSMASLPPPEGKLEAVRVTAGATGAVLRRSSLEGKGSRGVAEAQAELKCSCRFVVKHIRIRVTYAT